MSFKEILTNTFSFLKNHIEETFDKDDEIVSRDMSKILDNETDSENFYNAVHDLENSSKKSIEVNLSNGKKIDLIMK